ncbi:MAG: heavy metal translocating P-type ATPase metal-binding domain-containing protein, partial [Rubritalea sp.]|uniref:heavy metal translocating P-type ATPase metal-binding domain-containing protein n=1 Tax=Rubritalea sp. TaxID=2109375 RepID=UPI003242DA4A
MALCKHCSTPVGTPSEEFCCRGCESVFQLIHEDGLGLFYDLKAGDPLTPLRERPFQQKDWSWLLESAEEQNDKAVGSFTLGLSGMSCMACVWLVETVAKKQEGVIETCADNVQGSFEFSYQVETCDLSELADTLHRLGYELLPKKLGKQAGVTDSLIVRLGICGALAMNTMAFTLPRYN